MNEYTQYTFYDKMKFLYIWFHELSEKFLGTPKRVPISHSRQAIGFWDIEVLLYCIYS